METMLYSQSCATAPTIVAVVVRPPEGIRLGPVPPLLGTMSWVAPMSIANAMRARDFDPAAAPRCRSIDIAPAAMLAVLCPFARGMPA